MSKKITNFVLIELKLIDNVSDHSLSLGKSIVAFPVTTDEDFSHFLSKRIF